MEQFTDFAYVYDELNINYDKDKIIKRLKQLLGGCREVADLCCGTGDVAIALAKAGYKVTGIDISEDMLNVATEKAMENAARIQFVCMDAREFKLMKKADAVYSVTDGMNYMLDDLSLKRAFTAVYNALADNGIFVFDMSTKYKYENMLDDKTYTFDFDDVFLSWQNEYDSVDRICTMYVTGFLKNDDESYSRFDEIHKQRSYDCVDIKQMLENCGFELENVYSCYDEHELNENDERALYVARKCNKRE